MATENSVIEQRIDAEEAEVEKIRAAMYATGPDDTGGGDDQLSKADSDTQKDRADDDSKDGGGGDDSGSTDTAGKDAAGDDTDSTDTTDKTGQTTDKEEESFKAKYLSLKGKYDKELPKYAGALKSAKAELVQWQEYAASLETKIKSLEVETPKKDAVQPDAKPVLDLEDPELKTLLGDYPGAAKLFGALEKERSADKVKIAELEAVVNSKLKTIESDAEVSKAERFGLNMVALVGKDWQKIDADPEFMEFLSESVPYTGRTRLQLLKAASAALDAPTVAQFFNDFLATKNASDADDDTGAGEDTTSADRLKKQLAPPRSGGSAPLKKAELDQVYTRKQYDKFMDDSTRGRFKPKEWGGRTEAEMDLIFDRALVAGTLR
jgi:hypothetical protein